jgi:hypothetical protein
MEPGSIVRSAPSFKNEGVITPRTLFPALFSLVAFAVAANATSFGPLGCSTCGAGFNASAFNVVTLGTSTGNAGNFTPNSDIGGGSPSTATIRAMTTRLTSSTPASPTSPGPTNMP